MRSREKRGRVVVDFVSLFQEGDRSKDILLRRGDIVHVPQLTRTITVSGQIVNPGRIPFKGGQGYRDYIREAGGYSKRASKGKVRVIKGTSGVWFDAGDTELEPGDTIWIPEKPHRDYWELLKDFMTVAAQLATVYLVVDNARGN
jgi:protein involved in polysaccharide export with SLBB domain